MFNKKNNIQNIYLINNNLKPNNITIHPNNNLYIISNKFLITFKIINTNTKTYITKKNNKQLPSKNHLINLNKTKIYILNNYKITLYKKHFQKNKPINISIHIKKHNIIQYFLKNKLNNKFLFPNHNQQKLLYIS